MDEDDGTGYAGPIFEVEFLIKHTTYPVVGATECEDCTFDLTAMVPRPDGRYAEIFDVSGVEPAPIEAVGSSHDAVDVTLIREYEDGGLFEFLVTDECPAATLANLGAFPRRMEERRDGGRIVAEIPPRYDPSTVIEGFLAKFPGASLASKRERESLTPPFTRPAFRETLQKRLTARQREVLRVAFDAGYYEWPRESTGEEVAAELGISSATFSEHVHAAERKLLTAAFVGLEDGRGSGQ